MTLITSAIKRLLICLKMINTKFKQTEIGEIPQEWELKVLSDVADINKYSINKDYIYTEIEYIDVSSILEGQIFETQKLSLSDAPSRARRILKNDDVLISTVRPNLKHYAYIKNVKPNTLASTGYAVISSKKIYPRYLYYYLTTDSYTDFLTAIADTTTSTYPAFRPNVLENSLIPFPPLEEQKQIASVLSSLDDKIELNQKTIKTLEEIGQTLFKRWFVDFDFPNEKGEPYKSSGGEMIDSELGEIPKGWKCSTIGNELKTYLGGTPSRENINFWKNGTINWINSGKVNEFRVISPSEKITEEAMKKSATKLLSKGTVVLAITGATLGQYSLLEIDSCFNQSVVGITESTKFKKEYIYYWVSNTINDLINSQTGGAQQHINKQVVDSHKLLIPQESILEKYYLLVELIFQQISNKCFEIKDFTETRDLLLPKLLSGKIRI